MNEIDEPAARAAGVPDLLPVRMLNEYVYCPRLFHLEWVQREWADSHDTESGRRDHRVVDRPAGDLPDPEQWAEGSFRARAVLLEAPREGLVATLDLLEGADGCVVPVDTKHGAPTREGEAWEADRVQVGAQALVLRENGYDCREAQVYYARTRRRVTVPIDEELVARVRGAAGDARAAAACDQAPPPLVDSPRCPRCSLVGICMPDEHNALRAVIDASADGVDIGSAAVGTSNHSGALSTGTPRALVPARDDARPLIVQDAGAVVGKRGEELEVRSRGGEVRRVRLIDVSQLVLMGSAQVTPGARAALLGRGVPVAHFSHGGWFHGVTRPIGDRNAYLRLHQYAACTDSERALALARGFVVRKIRNARTLLRRNGHGDTDARAAALRELARCAKAAHAAASPQALLGIEGQAARTYFARFDSMLRNVPRELHGFSFEHRNRRPPKDPVNALLSLAYSILAKDWTVVLFCVGLDPFLGLFHRPRFGRPALALDLMEEFRPIIADSVVLQLLNNGEVREQDFVRRGAGVALTPEGRRAFFRAWERRVRTEVRHPLFRYELSYRRLFEVQARLLGRTLSGELEDYSGFEIR